MYTTPGGLAMDLYARGFFHPESLAIVGVSDAPSNLARVIVENLQRFRYKGRVYPVGNTGQTAGDLRILRNISDIEEVPDLAVLLIPARFVPEQLAACGQKGIRHVVVETGGFSEYSTENRGLEDEVISIAQQYGIRLVGPNCFGVINFDIGLILPFFVLRPQYMRKGYASMVSQSGGIVYDTCMLCSVENVGLSKLVSMGNKLDLNEADFLDYLIADRETKVIGLYLEDFAKGRELMRLAAGTDKPVVLLKANRSSAGTEIARFHTAALTGDDAVADAAIRQAGIHRVNNLVEMIDLFKIFDLPLMRGRRLGLITRSGGHGVLAADAAHRYGFELARFSDSFFEAARESKRSNVIRATNPLDIGDVYDMGAYGDLLELALREDEVDGVGFIVTFSSESEGLQVEGFVKKASEIMSSYEKPVALCVISNKDQWFAIKQATDMPIFADIDTALKALRSSFEHWEWHSDGAGAHVLPDEERQQPSRCRVRDRQTAESRLAKPSETFDLLKQYGVPVVDYEIVREAGEAILAARRIGYPVALKMASAEVLHKTERGGVRLNIAGQEQLEAALREMEGDSFIVQKMVPPGRELIVGVKADAEFGPVLVLGLGGIFAELLKDVSMRILPIDRAIARQMIDQLRGAPLLKGFRGEPASDLEALEDVLLAVSRLCIERRDIVNLDINPVILHEEGQGCVVVDAKLGHKD
jgi:acetate---CoA ligase (ADP-forming)